MRSTLRLLFFGGLLLSGRFPAAAVPASLTFDPPLPYSDQRVELDAALIFQFCQVLDGVFERSGNRFELLFHPCFPITQPPINQHVSFVQNLGPLPPGVYTFHLFGDDEELARLTVLSSEGLCAPGAGTLCFDGRRFGAELGFTADVHQTGARFDPNKLLWDPYGRELSHDPSNPVHQDWSVYNTGDDRAVDSGPVAPKSLAMADEPADLGDVRHCPTPPDTHPERVLPRSTDGRPSLRHPSPTGERRTSTAWALLGRDPEARCCGANGTWSKEPIPSATPS